MPGSSQRNLRGLYAITDARLQAAEVLSERVGLAIAGGTRIIQYRDKSADRQRRLQQTRALADLCQARGVCLIVNDDVALAADGGAHGVHLGSDDTALSAARRLLGDKAIIGISCYNRLELAQQAVDQGADYVAFGSFFPSQTKPAAVPADVALIRSARVRWSLPIAAIGGITADNAGPLLAAGADMLAVVRGVFAAADVREAAAAYVALFRAQHGTLDERRSG